MVATGEDTVMTKNSYRTTMRLEGLSSGTVENLPHQAIHLQPQPTLAEAMEVVINQVEVMESTEVNTPPL